MSNGRLTQRVRLSYKNEFEFLHLLNYFRTNFSEYLYGKNFRIKKDKLFKI